MRTAFSRLSLSAQFLLLSSPILLAATLVIGWWIGRQVENSVVHRIGGVTALYVDSFVAPHVQTLLTANTLSASDREALDKDLANTPLGRRIISLKVWRKDGHVLFSSDPDTMGRTFAIGPGLAKALAGDIFSEISERSDVEQTQHGQPLPRLIETYTPIHARHTGDVIAAAEFYERPDEVDRESAAAQRRSWLLVAGTMLTMYLLLFIVVRRGSQTITEQQRDLGTTVSQLTEMNAQNTQLQERVIRAAERATALNENLLQRISADIHDGPGQDLGFALMQLKNLGDASAVTDIPLQAEWAKCVEPARLAVQSALVDLRAISADLELPDIAHVALRDIAARVVRDFQAKWKVKVYLEPGEAIALGTGVLVASVMDVFDNGMHIAILDTSATAHMPDVLEMPYRPVIIDAGDPGVKAHTVRLGGMTCLAGDVIGDYSFDRPLVAGDKLVFLDMAHYTMVKTTTFNGVRLPSIATHEPTTRTITVHRRFGYRDYRDRLS